MTVDRDRQRFLVVIFACCIVVGAYGWAVFFMSFDHDGVIGPIYNAPGSDYVVFYSAARAYFSHDLSLLLDPTALTAQINRIFAGWFTSPLPFHPWVYPPQFLLMLLPFGLPSFGLSYAAFMVLTLAAAIVATWSFAATPGGRWLHALSLALCPAASICVISGQNGFLTAALLVGGFGLSGRAPIAAGVLLGILAYKPQFWLAVPVALLAARNWRTLASAAAAACVLALASALVLGLEFWWGWIRFLTGMSAADYQTWLEWGRLWGLSIFTDAVLLGASPPLANLMQAVVTGLALVLVYWTYRRPLPRDVQMAVLLCATVLAAPHLSPYDLVLPAIAATLLLNRARSDGLWPCPAALLMAAWVMPVLQVPRVSPVGFLIPVIICALIGSTVAGYRPIGARPIASAS